MRNWQPNTWPDQRGKRLTQPRQRTWKDSLLYAYDTKRNADRCCAGSGGRSDVSGLCGWRRTTANCRRAKMVRHNTKFPINDQALYNYGLRYCSTKLGRWVSRDPIPEPSSYSVLIQAPGIHVGAYLRATEERISGRSYSFLSNDPIEHRPVQKPLEKVGTGTFLALVVSEATTTTTKNKIAAPMSAAVGRYRCRFVAAGGAAHGCFGQPGGKGQKHDRLRANRGWFSGNALTVRAVSTGN